MNGIAFNTNGSLTQTASVIGSSKYIIFTMHASLHRNRTLSKIGSYFIEPVGMLIEDV